MSFVPGSVLKVDNESIGRLKRGKKRGGLAENERGVTKETMSRPRRMRYGTGACWLAVAVMLTVLAEISEGKEMTCEDADELARQLKDEGRLEEAKAALLQLLEVCPEEAGECGRTGLGACRRCI